MPNGDPQDGFFCPTLTLMIDSYNPECEGVIEKFVLRIAVWHHEACRLMKNGDHEERIFYLILTQIMDCFSCSSLWSTYILQQTTIANFAAFSKITNKA